MGECRLSRRNQQCDCESEGSNQGPQTGEEAGVREGLQKRSACTQSLALQ